MLVHMLSIGEFAGITGLSTKALRHYDEKRVLVPAWTDPASGYRYYAEDQVRVGVVARSLRAVGDPLPLVAQALATGDAVTVVESHRSSVLAGRLPIRMRTTSSPSCSWT